MYIGGVNALLKIKYWRKKRKLTQLQFAELLQVSQGYVSKLEKNLKNPTMNMIFKIAAVLEVCPKDLIHCDLDCDHCSYKSCSN